MPRFVVPAVVLIVVALTTSGCGDGNPSPSPSPYSQRKIFTWGSATETPYEAVNRQIQYPSSSQRELVQSMGLHEGCTPNNWHNDVDTGAQWVSFRRGDKCPITLARMVPVGDDPDTPDDFELRPYPSWELNGGSQTVDHDTPWRNNPQNLQSVLGFAVDPCHRMWIIDQGASSGLAATAGMPKVVVYDVSTPDAPVHLFTHTFSAEVVSLTRSFLDDVSVDLKHNFLYITDAGNPLASDIFATDVRAGLVIYDIDRNASWRVLEQHRSVQPQSSLAGGEPAPETPGEDYWFVAAGERTGTDQPALVGADGVGLSADADTFYFTALSATTIWAVPTQLLREGRSDLWDGVGYVGNTRSAAGGIVSGDDNLLYLTAISNSSLTRISPPIATLEALPHYLDPEVLAHDDVDMQWPDGIDFDNNGHVVAIANRMQTGINQGAAAVHNMVMWSVDVGTTKSYMWPWKDNCPSVGIVT